MWDIFKNNVLIVVDKIYWIMDNGVIEPTYYSLIFEIRGYKVMTDFDLAALYGTETKVLKQQVKRNIDRFPKDFMFILSKEEKNQLVTICDRLSMLKHSSINPMVFTEQGVAMLSSVLRSPKAISVNIEIMRAFAKYRALLLENNELKQEIDGLDKKINEVYMFLIGKIDTLYKANKDFKERGKIGY